MIVELFVAILRAFLRINQPFGCPAEVLGQHIAMLFVAHFVGLDCFALLAVAELAAVRLVHKPDFAPVKRRSFADIVRARFESPVLDFLLMPEPGLVAMAGEPCAVVMPDYKVNLPPA